MTYDYPSSKTFPYAEDISIKLVEGEVITCLFPSSENEIFHTDRSLIHLGKIFPLGRSLIYKFLWMNKKSFFPHNWNSFNQVGNFFHEFCWRRKKDLSVFFSFRRLNSFFRQEPYPQILLKKGKRLVCFFFLPKVKFFLQAGALSTNFAEEEKNLCFFPSEGEILSSGRSLIHESR